MKKFLRLVWVSALAAVIVVSMAACIFGSNDDSDNNGGNGGGNNGGGNGGGSGTNPSITIKNNTGYTTNGGIWIKPSTVAFSWGDNLAYWSWDQLTDGQSKAYTLSQPLSTQNVYDIRLKGGGFTFTKYNFTVSEGMIVTFTTSDLEQ